MELTKRPKWEYVAIALLSALIYGYFGLLLAIFFWSIPGVFGVLLYRYPELRNETNYFDHAAITLAELMIGVLGGWILFSIGYWHRASFHDRDLVRKAKLAAQANQQKGR